MADEPLPDQTPRHPTAPPLDDLVLISASPEEEKQWYLYPEFDVFVLTSLFIFVVALIDDRFGMRDACLFIGGLAAVYMVTCTIRRARL